MTTDAKVKLLTVEEVAKGWGVSKMTVYRFVHLGLLPAIRLGRSYRLYPRDVAAFQLANYTGKKEDQ